MEYVQVNTCKELKKIISKISTHRVMGIDIETDGLDPYLGKIRLLQLAVKDNPVYIINWNGVNNQGKELLNQLFGNILKVFHNAKYDSKFLIHNGINIDNKIFDTMLAEQVLNSGMNYSGFSLENLVKKYLNFNLDKSFQQSNWNSSLTEEQLEYAAMDAYILLQLYQILKKELKKEKLAKIARLESKVAITTARMELNGMRVDEKQIKEISEMLTKEADELEIQIKIILPKEINLNSPKQVVTAFNNLGIPVEKTEKDYLKQFEEEYEVIKLLLQYKKAKKRISYIDKILESIHPKTNRIHAQYKQCGTVTGRYSCTKPNLQNVPNEPRFRKCFVPEKGNVFVLADYSQIELRIVAEIANDETMIKAYRNGEDIHKKTAALINGKDIKNVTKNERQGAKAMNFGLIYGMGYKGFARYAFTRYGVEMTEEEVIYKVNEFFSCYSGIADRLYRLQNLNTYESRTIGGRRRMWKFPPPLTELSNADVQGTGADMLKRALWLLDKQLRNIKDVKLIGIVHDEIIIETPERDAKEVAEILTSSMERAGRYYLKKVPVIAEASICKSWAEK